MPRKISGAVYRADGRGAAVNSAHDLTRNAGGYGPPICAQSILSDAKRDIKELDAASAVLPKVGPNGESECPFAAQLYVQKEGKARKVADQWIRLRYHMDAVEDEIGQYQKALSTAGKVCRGVNTGETHKQALYAYRRMESRLHAAEDERRQTQDALEYIERVLAYSARLSHPGVPPVDVPAWPPDNQQTNQQRTPSPPSSGLPPADCPFPSPGPFRSKPPFGLGKGGILPPAPPLGGPLVGRPRRRTPDSFTPVPPPTVKPPPLLDPCRPEPPLGLGKGGILPPVPPLGEPLVGKARKRKPDPLTPVNPPVAKPPLLPDPFRPKPPFGLGKGDALLAPPILGEPLFGRDKKRRPDSPFSATAPLVGPLPLPAPIPPKPPFGLGKGDTLPAPPILGGPKSGSNPWICPKPLPIPHPVGGTDMVLKPSGGAIYL